MRRAAITEYEALRAEQNAFGKQVAQAPKEEKAGLVAQAQDLASGSRRPTSGRPTPRPTSSLAVQRIGNVVIDGVPAGGEDDYVVLREVGEIPAFDFEPRDHLEIGELLDAIDMERGAKVSGARFYYLKGIGARLELAIMNMGLDRALAAGFTPLITPTLVRPEIMQGTGFLGAHSEEIYYLPDDELYLTGTSEVALAGYHADEILDLSNGPHALRRLVDLLPPRGRAATARTPAASSACTSSTSSRCSATSTRPTPRPSTSACSRGRRACCRTSASAYRVIDTAAGDLGSSAARKYDVEAWVPTQGAYRELTSTSNCTTYQARRLDIRHRTESGKT